ncbi:sensor histidine kinase [Sphingorhabdus arenilitoris]|uniref:histidine kinase n=1 Tax=Sphingorhabdus arenilitoris TaxID=1490041 RepID=A0ABV8RC71_9SPHN
MTSQQNDKSLASSNCIEEATRLQVLDDYHILDTDPDIAFDRITKLASDIFDVPIALVSMVDEGRQWFKSAIGLEDRETPRDIAFCDHTIRNNEPMIVPDARADERFSTNPLVTGAPKIRFYAGAPLQTNDGHTLGTLCIIDNRLRHDFGDRQMEQLQDLADIVMAELDLRKTILERDQLQRMLDKALNYANVAVWELDTTTDQVKWAGAAAEIWGSDVSEALVSGDDAFERIVKEDLGQVQAAIEAARQSDQSYSAEFRINHPEKGMRWLAGHGNFDMNDGVALLSGVNFDITEVKQQQALSELLTRELHHRMRNLFATMRAIITLTRQASTSIEDYIERVEGRLKALHRAQSVLLNADFLSGSIHALMKEMSDAYPRIKWQGEQHSLSENAMVALSLILNELATNAVKYGALSNRAGGVKFDWTVSTTADDGTQELQFVWQEHDGPPIKNPPSKSSFGTQLIERSVRDNLGGRLERDWNIQGLICRIAMPLK